MSSIGKEQKMSAVMKNNSGTETNEPFDSAPLDEIRARRNRLAGYWAGQKLNLSGDALSTYATEVHESDYKIAGDADIIAKLTHDLEAHGIIVSEGELSKMLKSFHRQSLLDSHSTD
ncbi:ATPase inhibitor subunit zeta [Pararhizobium sp.]|uniref:ATPase inhibitor subunit zeta n=1 Tax=Pararhizobium sp. TaxID=1977563 RepID=UPI003D0EF2A7